MAKILHVIDHMGVGGAQRIVADLVANGLGDYVYAIRRIASEEIKLTGDTKNFYSGNSPFAFLFSIYKINKLLKETDISIVHCHLRAGFFVGVILAVMNKKVKFVFHEHGWILFGSLFYKILLRLASKHGVILACSEYIGIIIKQIDKDINIKVLPNFIDLDKFFPSVEKREEFRERFTFMENDILIGFAGRLVREKGWRELINAFSQLEERKNVYLLLAGIGPDMDRIKELLRNEKIKNVRLLGYESDMLGFYNGLDVFVTTSLIEAFGLVQLEAQACGIPVIASNIYGIKETLDSTSAIMVPSGDIIFLTKKMQELIDYPDIRNKLSAKGLENAKSFSLKLYIKKLKKVYKD